MPHELSFFQNKLPMDIKKVIFESLSIADLSRNRRVCKEWSEIINGLEPIKALAVLQSITVLLKYMHDDLLSNVFVSSMLSSCAIEVERLLEFSPFANSLIFDYLLSFRGFSYKEYTTTFTLLHLLCSADFDEQEYVIYSLINEKSVNVNAPITAATMPRIAKSITPLEIWLIKNESKIRWYSNRKTKKIPELLLTLGADEKLLSSDAQKILKQYQEQASPASTKELIPTKNYQHKDKNKAFTAIVKYFEDELSGDNRKQRMDDKFIINGYLNASYFPPETIFAAIWDKLPAEPTTERSDFAHYLYGLEFGKKADVIRYLKENKPGFNDLLIQVEAANTQEIVTEQTTLAS